MSVNIGAANIAKVRLAEQGSDPAAPAAGYGYLYCKDDGELYFINDDGTVRGPLVEAGQVKLDDWATPDDNTDLDASASAHGLLPKLSGTAGEYLAGDGSWGTPAGASQITTITFVIDGGGAAITTGIKGDLEIPFACTLNAWTLLADQSGAIKIDVWKDTYANYPPTDADSITNAHEPEIAASGVKAQDTDISDWADVTVDAGDILRFNVDSAATVERVTLSIKVTKS